MESGFRDEHNQKSDNEIFQTNLTSAETHLSSMTNKENKKKKLIDASHGLRFESKLLTLFCLRGLGASYKFELSKEKEDEGGKLEDLIFRYEVPDKSPAGKHWRYRFLQAKHKENEEEKITADHLLDYNRKGDFSLPKYFHSYYKIRARGEDIHDCIICTNIGFNLESLENSKVELISIQEQPESIFELGLKEKTARYKLKIIDEVWRKKLKGEWSPLQLLFEELKDCATKNKTTDTRTGMFISYHVALVDESVIDYSTKKFHHDFVSGVGNFSGGAKELRQTISELCENDEWKGWKFKLSNNFGKGQSPGVKNPLPRKIRDEDINDFFDKFIFVVDMPNEKKFEEIMETRDVSKYYHSDHCKDQTIRIFHEMATEFTNKEQNYWLKSENAKKILLAGVTKISLEYQNKLQKEIAFNDNAIECMVNQLKQKLLGSTGKRKVQRIIAPSPQHTAVKVISAVQILMRELKQEDNYLVVPSSRLQDEAEAQRWKNILKLQTGLHHFLVVVRDNEGKSIENLIVDDHSETSFTILISRDGQLDGMTDEIKYEDLSKDFSKNILSTEVSFQGEDLTVGALIDNKQEDIIDFRSIKDLLFEKKKVRIPSYDTSRFEESPYIKRRLKIPTQDSHFEDEVAKRLNCTVNEVYEKFRIGSDGHIEWLVEDEHKKEIWEKMKNEADKISQSSIVAEDSQFIFQLNEGKERSVVVISGVAGTGKSSLLSHYYKEIKKAKPDHWVFRINLVDQREALMKFNSNQTDAADFFINYLQFYKDSFTNSLFRHRLETGDRIVFMFDGFDEIDDLCQKKAIQLMKSISKKKSIQLYVTTRPHSVNCLQDEFFQFSYILESFHIDDQINYLVKYWETRLQHLDIQDKSIILNFAESLADRVSQTIKDKERSFIGVPLQCRILAECFQPELQAMIKHNNKNKDGMKQTDYNNQLFTNFNFDLNSLYKLLMKTKRQVFCEEKANAVNQNQIMDYAINSLIRKIESHLTKLAIETLVTEKTNVDILWPPQLSYHQLESKKIQDERTMAEFSVQFGLITFREGDGEEATIKTQFLHRTFAEYLFAKYLFNAMAVNHCEDNQLLDNEAVRDLIANQILVQDNYDGVRVFIDSMLKETVHSEQWRRVIKKELELPNRLQNFACNLANYITNPREDESFPLQSLHRNPLSLALYKANMNLFFTLFESLDRKFDKTEMSAIVRSAFDRRYFSFDFFLNFSNGEFFRRVVSYYDDADAVEVQRIVKEILYRPIRSPLTIETYRFLWEKEQTKEIVKSVLDLTKKHRTILNTVWDMELNYAGQLPFPIALFHFFVFNEYYDSLFNQFFYLLSSVYLNDGEFVNLLKFTLRMRDANNNNWAYPSNSGIKKTLTNLRDLGRYKVMQGLSHLALVSDKKIFDEFYQPCRPNKGEAFEFQLLLEKDSSGMTRLHRTAFYGDKESVHNILEKNHSNFSSGKDRNIIRLLVESVKDKEHVLIDERFTPFYVAAACGNKDICLEILFFLKGIVGAANLQREFFDNCDGFLHRAMWDAVLFKNLHMFQLVLEVVKEAWGQNSLLVLLKAQNHSIYYEKSEIKYDKEVLKIKVKVLLQNDSEKGYEDLNDLVLVSRDRAKIEKIFEDMEDETLQGMLSSIGLVNWMKRFLQPKKINDWVFRFLSNHLLTRFTSHQRSQFVDGITSLHIPTIFSSIELTEFFQMLPYPVEISYWAEWLIDTKFASEDFDCLERLLKCILDNENNEKTDMKKLLFNDNGKDITRVLLFRNQKLFLIMSKHLPSSDDQLKIKNYITENGHEILDELFQSENGIRRHEVLRNWVNILPFYDDRGRKQQFEKLVKTILFLRTERYGQDIQYSFWSRYLDSYEDEESNKVEVVNKFLTCVSEKLGKRALRKVVLHKDCMGLVILGAELHENKQLVKIMLNLLSDRDRDYVNHLIVTNCPFNSRRYKSIRTGEPCQCKHMNSCYCWQY